MISYILLINYNIFFAFLVINIILTLTLTFGRFCILLKYVFDLKSRVALAYDGWILGYFVVILRVIFNGWRFFLRFKSKYESSVRAGAASSGVLTVEVPSESNRAKKLKEYKIAYSRELNYFEAKIWKRLEIKFQFERGFAFRNRWLVQRARYIKIYHFGCWQEDYFIAKNYKIAKYGRTQVPLFVQNFWHPLWIQNKRNSAFGFEVNEINDTLASELSSSRIDYHFGGGVLWYKSLNPKCPKFNPLFWDERIRPTEDYAVTNHLNTDHEASVHLHAYDFFSEISGQKYSKWNQFVHKFLASSTRNEFWFARDSEVLSFLKRTTKHSRYTDQPTFFRAAARHEENYLNRTGYRRWLNTPTNWWMRYEDSWIAYLQAHFDPRREYFYDYKKKRDAHRYFSDDQVGKIRLKDRHDYWRRFASDSYTEQSFWCSRSTLQFYQFVLFVLVIIVVITILGLFFYLWTHEVTGQAFRYAVSSSQVDAATDINRFIETKFSVIKDARRREYTRRELEQKEIWLRAKVKTFGATSTETIPVETPAVHIIDIEEEKRQEEKKNKNV